MKGKKLFAHQKEAIKALKLIYNDKNKKRAGLVVIPTGGGKTFTAVTWLNMMYEEYGSKIIWFAQSFELLNQAYLTIDEINPNIKKRVISSNSDHSSVRDIEMDDEFLVITTQTAMLALRHVNNKFNEYLGKNKSEHFIAVIDEAHHVPARGCRSMINNMFERLDKVWLLGLTATPTYTDRSRRGWLWKIFSDGIVYEVDKRLLQRERILAKENIIRKKTPQRIEISDKEFNRLVRYNSDVPENIIEELASNQDRNDFILNEYILKKDFYGKTIIFLDRWYQCVYFKDKLNKNGINADAIYYQNPDNVDEKNSNKAIIECFRNDNLQVLLNIKMMTEGADVPDIKTVFITRETTSHILLQQMIGRALRGERAGGKKDTANIVLFGDNWNKNIAWAKPELGGGIEESRIYNSSTPINKVSLNLVEKLVKLMTFQSVEVPSYLSLIPIGWYAIEYIVFGEEEKIEVIHDNILVYEGEREKWEKLFDNISKDHDEVWADESLDIETVNDRARLLIDNYIPDVNESSIHNVIKVCRHILQNDTKPEYFLFSDRDKLDLEKVASSVVEMNSMKQYNYLMNEYTKSGSIWSSLYENFFFFKSAVDMYVNRILFNRNNAMEISPNKIDKSIPPITEAQENEIVKAVKYRDGNACTCCGLTSKETKLVISNIYNLGPGKQNINNLQTLCSRCNTYNKKNHVNFKNNKSALVNPKQFEGIEFDSKYIKNITRLKAAIKASVNIFYECSACYEVRICRRSNSVNYHKCKILLYSENNLKWLNDRNYEVKKYIVETLQQSQVNEVSIIKVF